MLLQAAASNSVTPATHGQWAILADFFNSLHQLGSLYEVQGLFRQAVFYFKRGVHYASGAGSLSNVCVRFYLALATLSCKNQQYEQAEGYLHQADACVAAYAENGHDKHLEIRA